MINPFPEVVPDVKYIQEQWFPICDFHYPGINPWYQISTWGRVYNGNIPMFYPGPDQNDEDAYVGVTLSFRDGSSIRPCIHRVMMHIFHPIENEDAFEVNHIDGIKYHNWIWNLEWVTHQENMEHARATGLTRIGEETPMAVISNAEANMIADLIAKGLSPQEIEKTLRPIIGDKNIASISKDMKYGLSWRHITDNYDFSQAYDRRKDNFKFTDEQVHKICQIFVECGTQVSYKQVLNMLGIYYGDLSEKDMATLNTCISYIRKKKTYKNITSQYDY